MNNFPWFFILLGVAFLVPPMLFSLVKNREMHPCVAANAKLLGAQLCVLGADLVAAFLILFLIGAFLFPFTLLAHLGLCIYAVIIFMRGVTAYRKQEVHWVTPAISLLLAAGPPLLVWSAVVWFQHGSVRNAIHDRNVGVRLAFDQFEPLAVPEKPSSPKGIATPQEPKATICGWLTFEDNGLLPDHTTTLLRTLETVQKDYGASLRIVCVCVPPVERTKDGKFAVLPIETNTIVRELTRIRPPDLRVTAWYFDRNLYGLNKLKSYGVEGLDPENRIVFCGGGSAWSPDILRHMIRHAFPHLRRR